MRQCWHLLLVLGHPDGLRLPLQSMAFPLRTTLESCLRNVVGTIKGAETDLGRMAMVMVM